MVFLWLSAAEVESFDVNHSFLYLSVIFEVWDLLRDRIWVRIHLDPPNFAERTRKAPFDIDPIIMENVSLVAIGILIVFILIKEPHGLARLWHPESKNYASGPLLIRVDLTG